MLRCISCKQHNVGSCFTYHSLNLCLFTGELNPLLLNDINDQWLLTPVIFFLVVVFVCFLSLSCVGGGLSDAYDIMGVVGFLELMFSFPYFL